MQIAVIGASGWIGGAVVREALTRGHQVTAIARDRSKLDAIDGVVVVAANATDPFSIAEAVSGVDAVVSSVSGKSYGAPPHALVATALLEALPRAGVRRLIVVGGAGGLVTATGTRVIDGPHFRDEWKPEANGQIEALAALRDADADVDWTVLSPAALIEPGERTGTFRVQAGDRLLTDDNGVSRISVEDYAAALVDELERPRHVRERFTVAY